jgi:SAM-dependent methyltransferase
MDSTVSKPETSTLPQIRQAALALRRSIAARGLLRTVAHLARRVTPAGGESSRANQTHPFDAEHGLETSGLISGRELTSGHVHDLYSTAYYGIAPSIFKSAIARWSRELGSSGRTIEEYSFVDVGAGKGRAVLLASEYGFRSVTGVELNSGLAAIAVRNAAQWKEFGRARCAVEIVNQDATEFHWPTAPLLVFLFNPFGRKVLAEVLHKLKQQAEETGRPVDVLYINPEFGFVADRFPGLRKLWAKRIEMSESDRAVDAFSSKSELCNAYRLSR